MTWYQGGTVAVVNGSDEINGTGTDFIPPNAYAGDAFVDEAGYTYEVVAIQSGTRLTIDPAYRGSSGGGRRYKIMPQQDYQRLLAQQAAALINSFAAVRDGIGQGLIPDGTVAAPGLRFSADQDTGVARPGPNILALVAGGIASLYANGQAVGIGTSNPVSKFHVNQASNDPAYATVGNNNGGAMIGVNATGMPQIMNFAGGGMAFGSYNAGGAQTEYGRFDANGNLLVGTTVGSFHIVGKAGAEGGTIFGVTGPTGYSVTFGIVNGGGQSAAGAAAYVSKHSGTGRSINAGGTINASGADYAEYMTKADGCGTIAAGDVCGVDRDGRLTRTWADAISFVVKSTDPAYVGGDVWGAHLPPRPVDPGAPPAAPIAPGPAPSDDDEAFAAWRSAADAYPDLVIAHQSTLSTWQAAKATYEAALPVWEAELEAARQTVDRIAFAGQVPVNIDGTFAVGDYLIAAANAGGIHAVAVPEADITFDQYRRRFGKVWAIRGDRPWIDVQHG